MPIYEYQCTECDNRLEALQKLSDSPLLDCPACYRPALVKLMSSASFRLKGGGWYETDFKTGEKKQLSDSDSDSKSGAATESDGKESKETKNAKESKEGRDSRDSKERKDSKTGKDSGPAKTESTKSSRSAGGSEGKPNAKAGKNTSNNSPSI